MKKDERLKAIVTTTIYVPVSIEGYLKNAAFYGHRNLFFIIIGDKKTPDSEVNQFLDKLKKAYTYEIVYFSAKEQLKEFADYTKLLEHIPWNVIQRRNLGILYAYLKGAELIVTIDDDNFVGGDDYLGHHSLVGKQVEIETFQTGSGWFNVCRFLKEKTGFPFYHRGYPMGKRWIEEDQLPSVRSKGKVVVNAGFWLGDPDVDAVTRLYKNLWVERYEREDNFTLAKGTWSPFNSQNTALAREIIPAYFLSPYVGRYDDVLSSYIVRAIADYLGDCITYGLPLVTQKRNPHDYYRDFEAEKIGMQITDNFCDFLRGIKLSGNDYGTCLEEILTAKDELIRQEKNRPFRAFYEQFFTGMKIWNEIF